MDKPLERMRALRAVRAALYEQLAILDQLGEMLAAIELNSAIELLNTQLGELTSDDEIQRLQRKYLSD
jgi:hypothetical protein